MKKKKGKKEIEVVRHLEDIEGISDLCGTIRPLSTKDDFKKASLAVATMKTPTEPHYHKKGTEFYFVIEGRGKLIVGRESYELRKGTMVIIPPHLAHYVIPWTLTRIAAFTVPAWTKDDQFVLEKADLAVGYSEAQEQTELINEILRREELSFERGMSREQREKLDVERQAFVLRFGLNRKAIPHLRRYLSP